MKLVVDTNCIMAALIRDGASRKIILHFEGELFTAAFSKDELKEHVSEITRKAKLSQDGMDAILDKLFSKIVIVGDSRVKSYLPEAKVIMEKIDPADVPFIAAALATSAAIWSDDRHFKMQNKIKVLTTKELLEVLK